jgi:allene oxide cyclase-like protein
MTEHHTMRAVARRVVGVGLVAAAVGGCGADTAARQEERGQVEVIELRVTTDQYASVDLDKAGLSLGDLEVYAGSATEDGRTVGNAGGSCQVTRIDGEKVTSQCLITMEFERGSVTVQSLWVRGESPLDMAITGGTGAYRDARGTVRFWDIATPNERLRAEITR